MGAPTRSLAAADATTADRRRGRARVALGATLALLLVLAALRWLGPASRDPSAAPPAPTPSASAPDPAGSPPLPTRPLFEVPTRSVLLFDEGGAGAVALDLDTGTVHRLRLPGHRPGDQPFRLWQQGAFVVVGWGEIWRVAPGPAAIAEPLAQATVFLPAAQAQQLWLVDDEGGGSTWTLLDGTEVVEVVSPPTTDGWVPVRGVPGGLAVRGSDGSLSRYDLDAGGFVDHLGDDGAFIVDVTHDQVAWCPADPCRRLHLEHDDPEDGEVTALGEGEMFRPDGVWLRPGGKFLAVDVWLELPDGATDRRLRIHDLSTGDVVRDAQLPLGQVHGAWDAAGEQFFAWVRFDGGGGPRQLLRWARGRGVETIDLRGVLDRAHGFVVLDREAVGDPASWSAFVASPR